MNEGDGNMSKKETTSGHPYKDQGTGQGLFELYDYDQFVKELEIKDKAKESGEKDLPPTEFTTEGEKIVLDSTEQEIVTRMGDFYYRAKDKVETESYTYSNRFERVNPDTLIKELDGKQEEANADLERVRKETSDRVEDARQDFITANQDFRRFRKRNKLNYSAQIPDSHIYHFGVLMFVFMAETWGNATFFAQGNELGIIGGWITAMVLSAVTLGMAFFAGRYAYTALIHRSVIRKLLGLAGVVVHFILWIPFLVLLAHYREASSDVENSFTGKAANTITKAFQDPLGFQEFDSILVIALGLVVGIVAIIDGWKFDEPYPGYGDITRKRNVFKEEFMYEREDAIEELRKVSEHHIDLLEDLRQRLNHSLQELTDIRNGYQTNITFFDRHRTKLVEMTNRLLRLYRDENRKFRSSDAPAYFRDRWEHEWPEPDVFQLVTEGSEQEIRNSIDQAIQKIGTLKSYLSEKYQSMLTEYGDLEIGESLIGHPEFSTTQTT